MRNYLSIKDVCGILGIGRDSAYKLFHLKGFPSIQVGRKYLVEENDFNNFINSYKKTKIFL